MKYKVAYIGAGNWSVYDEQDQPVGLLLQNVAQAWTARTADGERRLINTEREYGGSAHPYEIANTLVIW